MKSARLQAYLYTVALAIGSLAVAAGIFSLREVPAGVLLSAAAGISLVWLWFYWLRLAGQIARTRRLAEHSTGSGKSLDEQVKNAIDYYQAQISQLDNRCEELKVQLRLLDRQKRNVESIIFGIRDAVVVTDGFGRLVMANRRAGELFGFDPADCGQKPVAEVIGHKEFLELVHHSRHNQTRHLRREISVCEAGATKVFECIISNIWLSLTAAGPSELVEAGQQQSNIQQHQQTKVPVSGGPEAQLGQTVTVLHDITREKEVSQIKNEFISHVSHELKTPLASISAYAEMLADGEAEDEKMMREFCSIIQTQAARLNRLIEDILDISRIESGLIKVNKEPVSVAVLIRQAIEAMRSCAAAKNIELTEQSSIVCEQVYADKEMLLRVIINLISNAVKYTLTGGSVKVETTVNEADELVRVSVTDTGVGISPEEIGRVFDKFYRVQANSKYAGGTGLGLSLVKQIVEKVHNGRVFVTSQTGVGSTFGFELPLARREAAQMA
jgi:signal transduction histidine kinase